MIHRIISGEIGPWRTALEAWSDRDRWDDATRRVRVIVEAAGLEIVTPSLLPVEGIERAIEATPNGPIMRLIRYRLMDDAFYGHVVVYFTDGTKALEARRAMKPITPHWPRDRKKPRRRK